MNCSKCNAPIGEGEKFCQSCGAPVESVQNSVTENAITPSPKKHSKKKALIIIGAVLGVLIIAAVVAFTMRYQLLRAYLGEVNYYALTEVSTASSIIKDEKFTPLIKSKNITVDSKVTLDAGEDGTSQANVKYSYDKGKKKWTANASVDYFGNESGEITANGSGGKLSVKAPDITDKTVNVVNASSKIDTTQAVKTLTDLYPVIKKFEKKNMSEYITVSKAEALGFNCRTVTVSLTEKDYCLLMAEALETLASKESGLAENLKALFKDNEDLTKIISDITGATDLEGTEDIIDGYFSNIPTAVEEFREEAQSADDSETAVKYTVYYKNSHEVIQRELIFGEETATIITESESKSKSVNITFSEEGVAYLKYGYLKESKGKKTKAEFSMTQEGEELLKIKSDNLSVDKVNGIEVPTGDISLTINSGEVSAEIKMSAEKTYLINAELTDESGAFMTLSADTSLKNSADLKGYKEPADKDNGDLGEFFDIVLDKLFASEDLTYDDGEGEYFEYEDGDLGDLSDLGDFEIVDGEEEAESENDSIADFEIIDEDEEL